MFDLKSMSERSGQLSRFLNMVVEAAVATLLGLLVLDVWLAVMDRYLFHWQLPWPEVLARYLMIWAALLAASSGIARREHIGLSVLIRRFPGGARKSVLVAVDLVTLALFVYLVIYGVGFAQKGESRQAMILGLSLLLPFAAVPASAALCAIQTVLVGIRDLGHYTVETQGGEA
ncbi:TRAP transporter small permease [Hoeflea sp. TYP-13]|uniref:TRAP transporter small permease n=1 Tax=Hoeflea sp. TYP-13 TaxID=3230023 RepID=UPI0034C6B538